MLELRKDIFADERDDNLKEIGKGTQRQDMLGHVTGTSTYFNDHKLQGMLHLKVLRSPHAHARIRRIDTVEAERSSGVRRIIRGADVPRNLNTLLSLINFGKDDEPTLAVDKVRYKGEPVVAVVADSHREAYEAIAKIRVDYEPLPTVFDVEEALKPGAPVVNETYPKNTFTYHDIYDHQKLRFGDVERAFAGADHVLEQRYQMSPIEHAPTETNGSIAAPDTNGRYVVYTSTQALFFSLDTCAKILDLPSNTFHFIGGTVGGGFGGKVDTLTEPLVHPRRDADRPPGALHFRPRGGDAVRTAARRRTDLPQGRHDARRPHRRPQGAGLFRQRRLHQAVELRRGQMRGAFARALYDPQRLRRHLLRLHQSHAGDSDARLRSYRDGFRDRMPDGQACPSDRHGPDGVPHPQRLSRRRHEGASARSQEHCADRMRTGRGGKIEMAVARGIQADVLAQGRRRRTRTDSARAGWFGRIGTRARAATHVLRSRTTAGGRARAAATAADTSSGTAAGRAATRFAWRGAVFLRVRLKETLIMTRHRGRGIASINYPIGMNLGGDPSQALVHSNPSGKFTVSLSSIDLGQGMKSVTRQICAETLGVPVEDVYVDTADSDTGPHCMGSFASRGTHRVGNAVMAAAKEARGVMMEAAAEELEVNAADLETDGRGNIHVKGAPHRSISTKDVAIAAQFKQGKTISGRGIFLVPLSAVDPETGEMSPATCYAHACMVAEVEVDDETGEVAMVRMDSAYELGRALNPRLVEQQLVGGAWMGVSHALFETTEPYYPDPSHGPRDFVEYLMPGPGDICPHDVAVLERPAADGPFGAKGPGEMCANPVLPAVANAIFNAVGVRIDDLPITPEKVLRAIKGQGGARPQARR